MFIEGQEKGQDQSLAASFLKVPVLYSASPLPWCRCEFHPLHKLEHPFDLGIWNRTAVPQLADFLITPWPLGPGAAQSNGCCSVMAAEAGRV